MMKNPASQPTLPIGNRFAKFSIVAEVAPLWKLAAEELAQFATQVRAPASFQ